MEALSRISFQHVQTFAWRVLSFNRLDLSGRQLAHLKGDGLSGLGIARPVRFPGFRANFTRHRTQGA